MGGFHTLLLRYVILLSPRATFRASATCSRRHRAVRVPTRGATAVEAALWIRLTSGRQNWREEATITCRRAMVNAPGPGHCGRLKVFREPRAVRRRPQSAGSPMRPLQHRQFGIPLVVDVSLEQPNHFADLHPTTLAQALGAPAH